MDTGKAVLHDVEEKMKKTLEIMNQNLSAVRSGRANPGMVENIKVDYYGTMTPIKQLANITIPEPKILLIHPWDASAIKAVEKAINESELGVPPVVDGKMIRLAVPTLTRERREELVKIVKKHTEDSRVSMRAIRRDGNEKIKLLEKDKKITQDDSFKFQADVQKLTDKFIQTIDQTQDQKEKELLQN